MGSKERELLVVAKVRPSSSLGGGMYQEWVSGEGRGAKFSHVRRGSGKWAHVTPRRV